MIMLAKLKFDVYFFQRFEINQFYIVLSGYQLLNKRLFFVPGIFLPEDTWSKHKHVHTVIS